MQTPRWSHWVVLTVSSAWVLTAAGLLTSCEEGSPSSAPAPAPAAPSDPPPVTFDEEPGMAAPTLEDLREVDSLETHAEAGRVYSLSLGDKPLSTFRYYGLPHYPDAVGAEMVSSAGGESAPMESTYVAILLTPDPPAGVLTWYQERLEDWPLVVRYGPDGTALESILYQPPQGARRICVSTLEPQVALTLIGYQVYSGEGSPPLPLNQEAYRKWEDVMELRLALEQYRRDTGEAAEDLSALFGDTGPEGYHGPYLAGEPPTDPYSGEPYQIEAGAVVGPGDVEGFSG
ncbi:MAG: hypothetical protein GF320_21500 [Armatimonadia bacterium]|nr:hypothetical protein [Armatimonadia bacterium]